MRYCSAGPKRARTAHKRYLLMPPTLKRIWAVLKNYVANTAVTWPGRLRQIRSPDQLLAAAAPWTSP
jgi:hypothetical protein